MVNQTETKIVLFCYQRASSSPRYFRPKMAQCLRIFIFS